MASAMRPINTAQAINRYRYSTGIPMTVAELSKINKNGGVNSKTPRINNATKRSLAIRGRLTTSGNIEKVNQ